MLALFFPALIGALAGAMGSLIGRAVIALGIGFVTYKGLDLALGALQQQAMAGLSGIGGDMAGLLGFLWVDKAISVVFSAVTVSVALKAIGGSVKKAVLK